MRVRRKLVGGAGGECQAGGTSPGDLRSAERRGQETLAERVNADYRGGVTCLYDTQLLGACVHASESGGRYRPEAVRGMPDVPIAPPATARRLSALSAVGEIHDCWLPPNRG
jgi:hypothetical protein